MLKPVVSVGLGLAIIANTSEAAHDKANVQERVAHAVRPVMEGHGIPGMAVAIVIKNQSYVFNYGVASKETGNPVDNNTLFEIGSVTKTFTATLTCYAQVTGRLSLSDSVSKYFPSLQGSSFGEVTLLNLGTHTPGGLPLQVPNEVTNDDQLISYFKNWKPTYAPGTYRTYSNPSIGFLGLIAAKSLNDNFAALMERNLFPALGLKNTYINIPTAESERYAQGYTEANAPIRMTTGVLGDEAYGVRTTATDLLRFIEANMKMLPIDEKWQRALTDTHIGYYRIGAMTQDLIWEQYSYPVPLNDLLGGNSTEMLTKPNSVVKLDAPMPARDDVLINKTGSTNGFSTYVAFVPGKHTGIVLLANKRYPIDQRIALARDILAGLTDPAPIN